MSASNYFGQGVDAERYSRARPQIHATAVERFRSFARLDAPCSLALDVGCGTGQSTVALTTIADRVIGVDPSAEMLAHALPHPQVKYRQSTAEDTSLADGQFDLITAALAFHWFDRDRFLAESNRLLRLPGWLVIYTSWFTGEMKEDVAFAEWFRREFLVQNPTPARNATSVTEELAYVHGFALRGEDGFSNEVSMSIERFADYELSTTNIIAAVARGATVFDDAGKWIRASIAPFFSGEAQRTFLFKGQSWYLEKISRLCT